MPAEFADIDAQSPEAGAKSDRALLAAIGRAIIPSTGFRAVTPHDSTNISGGAAKALYIGGAGDVTAVNAAGTAILFTAVPAGTILPIRTTRVNSTGTTATAIVAL